MSHTQGKLTHRSFSIYASDGKTPVADTCLTNSVANHDVENARRLVAAWNACEGISTEDLESVAAFDDGAPSCGAMKAERDSLRAVNAELLEALILAEAALSDIGDADREPGDDVAWCEARAAQAIPTSRAAIASARKQENPHG